jgi:ABC-type Na+ transport system ATPase subunit NatA
VVRHPDEAAGHEQDDSVTGAAELVGDVRLAAAREPGIWHGVILSRARALAGQVDGASGGEVAPRRGELRPRAGGPDALVGHRGVRLSGGQVQRLALARALATEADLLLADDVSSALDASTEIELWQALRARGAAVIGATSKSAALAQADRVVVLDSGRVVDDGPWLELSARWAHLAG